MWDSGRGSRKMYNLITSAVSRSQPYIESVTYLLPIKRPFIFVSWPSFSSGNLWYRYRLAANFRKESPSVSARSRLNMSCELMVVRAARMSRNSGPRPVGLRESKAILSLYLWRIKRGCEVLLFGGSRGVFVGLHFIGSKLYLMRRRCRTIVIKSILLNY